MDTGLARSVFEFLLRHGVPDHVLKSTIRVIPFSDSDSRLKKSLFLWKIQSEIAKGSVSEIILEILECIEELEHGEEMAASEAMKRAYCAVAVECVVRCLGKGDEDWEYFNTVKRIWRGRVSAMETSEKVGLLSDELGIWKEEIELAIWDPNACENLRLKSGEVNALEAVRAYVAEAWAGMGPSTLEFMSGMEGDDIKLEKLEPTNTLPERAGERAVGLPDSRHDPVVSIGKQRGLRRKHVAVKHSRGATRTSTAKMAAEEMPMQTLGNNHGPKPNPEINIVQKAPRVSLLELKAVLQDHLRGASHISECINDRIVTEKMYEEPSVEGKNGVDARLASCVEKSDKAAQINDTSLDNQLTIRTSCSKQKVVVEEPNSDAVELSENIIASAVRGNIIEEPSVEEKITIDSKLLSPCVGKGVEAALRKEANRENGQPSQTSCFELKVPLPVPVRESTEAAPINEIALDNQQPTRKNTLKLKVVVEDPRSDQLHLPEHKTVSSVKESLNEEPSVERQNKVNSRRSLNRCVKKSVEITPVNEINLEGQKQKETNCSELKDGITASLFSDNSKSGMVRETIEQELVAEMHNNVKTKPLSPLLEKIVEATMANKPILDGQQPIQTSLEPKSAPLPDADRFSGNAISSKCRENTNQQPIEVGKNGSGLDRHSNYIGKTAAEATTRKEACLHCQQCMNQNNKPKPSFMERKRTRYTYEGDNSIDSSAVDSPKFEDKPQVRSQKRKAISPLRKNESKRVGRRKVRRWSKLEEDTLRAGVKKYDVGNWKLILDSYSNIFEGRTAVDLKDKWRNMLRYNAV